MSTDEATDTSIAPPADAPARAHPAQVLARARQGAADVQAGVGQYTRVCIETRVPLAREGVAYIRVGLPASSPWVRSVGPRSSTANPCPLEPLRFTAASPQQLALVRHRSATHLAPARHRPAANAPCPAQTARGVPNPGHGCQIPAPTQLNPGCGNTCVNDGSNPSHPASSVSRRAAPVGLLTSGERTATAMW